MLTILMVLSLMSAAASVNAAQTSKSLAGVETVKTKNADTVFEFKNGKKETVKNIVKTESLDENPIVEDVKSFEVVYEDKSILTVEPRDIKVLTSANASEICNGYYAVTFNIPDTSKECFLTGLSPLNVDVVQRELIKGYSEDDFSIENIDFIDAEKEVNGKDDELCWAAATSNILQYTGWGAKAGFKSEDEIFEDFSNSFLD